MAVAALVVARCLASTLAVAASVELVAVALIALRIRRARRAWRAARAGGLPRVDALDLALAATGLPARVAAGIAAELAIVGYAIGGWRAPAPRAGVITSHRTNGWPLYAGVFAALVVAEAPVGHLALAGFGHPTAAWIATAASTYSVVWLIGDVHALRHGGVAVTADALELRLGVRWRGRIPLAAIARVTPCSGAPAGAADLSILGANVVVELAAGAAPVTVRGLLGRRRTARTFALSIDDADAFAQMFPQLNEYSSPPAASTTSTPKSFAHTS
nr:hypothetical protein [Kofleriaceae bacterium]